VDGGDLDESQAAIRRVQRRLDDELRKAEPRQAQHPLLLTTHNTKPTTIDGRQPRADPATHVKHVVINATTSATMSPFVAFTERIANYLAHGDKVRGTDRHDTSLILGTKQQQKVQPQDVVVPVVVPSQHNTNKNPSLSRPRGQ